jgi:hypothetical protein
MPSVPSENQIKNSLIAAAKAHHEFQENYLSGVRHEQWAFWYAAYLIGRLGDFISPTELTRLLEEVTDEDHWYRSAAKHISKKIGI